MQLHQDNKQIAKLKLNQNVVLHEKQSLKDKAAERIKYVTNELSKAKLKHKALRDDQRTLGLEVKHQHTQLIEMEERASKLTHNLKIEKEKEVSSVHETLQLKETVRKLEKNVVQVTDHRRL